MRLAKFGFTLHFPDSPPRTMRVPARLIKAFGGNENDVKAATLREEDRQHIINVEKPDRVHFLVNPNAAVIEALWPKDETHAAGLVSAYLDKANRIVGFEGVKGLVAQGVYVEPREHTFEELVAEFRDHWFKPGPVVDEATDWSLALTLVHGRNKVNLAAGIIRPAELGRWGLNVPPDFTRPMVLAEVTYAYDSAPKLADITDDTAVARRSLDYSKGLAQRIADTVVEQPTQGE